MLSHLLQLLEALPTGQRIRRGGLFILAITLALSIYPLVRLTQLDPLFYRPFPASIQALIRYEFGHFQQAARLYRDRYHDMALKGAFSEDSLLAAIFSGDTTEAKQIAAELLHKNPDDVRALKALIEVALQETDLKSAGQLTERVLALNENDVEALLFATMISSLNQTYGRAINELNLALRTSESGTIITFLRILEVTGQLQDSEDPPFCLLAHYYRYLRMFDASKGKWAMQAAEQAIVAGDHPAEAYVTIGIALAKQGRAQRALGAFQKAIQSDPSFGMAYRWAAMTYAQAGDRTHSYLMHKAAFETDRTDSLFRDDLYFEMRDRKEFTRLAKAMETILLQAPTDLVAYSYAAYAYRQSGQIERAHELLRQALLLEPHGPPAYDAKAVMLQEIRRTDEAEQLLKKSIQLAANRPPAYRTLARLYQQQGRTEEALTTYEAVVRLRGRDEYENAIEFCSHYGQKDRAVEETCHERLWRHHR